MTILSDRWIRRMAEDKGMIEPFVDAQKRQGVISYGLSSYGYDARVGRDFKIFTNVDSAVVDPKNFADNSFVDRTADVCIIPPNSFALARTVEYFRIPRDVLVICLGDPLVINTVKHAVGRLRPFELAARFSPLMHVLAFEDGVVERPKPARIQRLCAIKTDSARLDRLRLPA